MSCYIFQIQGHIPGLFLKGWQLFHMFLATFKSGANPSFFIYASNEACYMDMVILR